MIRTRMIVAGGVGLFLALLPWLDQFLCGGDLPERADAVIVLAGGHYTTQRVIEGLRLMEAGYATNLIVSGVEFDSKNENFVPEAMRLVEHRPVTIDSQSRITRDTALLVRQMACERQWARVLVVTSEFHWRRTRALFRYDRPAGLGVRICTVHDEDLSQWWRKPATVRLLKNELWFLMTFYLLHTPYGIIAIVIAAGIIVSWRRLIA